MKINFKNGKRVIALGIVLSIILGMLLSVPAFVYGAELTSINNEYQNISLNIDKNIIYINFHEKIKGQPSEILEKIKLYKIPKADSTAVDSKGNTYDEKVIYNSYNFGEEGRKIIPNTIIKEMGEDKVVDAVYNADQNVIDKFSFLEDLTNLKEDGLPIGMDIIPIEKTEIINNTTIKIKPNLQLKSLNKYGLKINKDAVKYENGTSLKEDVLLTFWTHADNKNTSGKWLKPEKTENESIKKNNENSYTLSNTPQYGPENPIVLNLDREVILKAEDDILEQKPEDPRDTKRISYDALQKIELIDVYGTQAAINEAEENKENESNIVNEEDLTVDIVFGKYEIFYYFEDNIKKTKVFLYPKTHLDFGKKYELKVPKNTFETRSGNGVTDFKIDLLVKGQVDDVIEVYTAKGNQAKVTDVWKQNNWTFTLYGRNFQDKINKVELVPLSENLNETIVIEKEDVDYISLTELRINIKGKNSVRFSKEEYVGNYEVVIYLEDSDGTNIPINTDIRFDLLSKEEPKVLNKEPEGNSDKWYDEYSLGLRVNPQRINGEYRYFLKVTFEDIDGKLEFNSGSNSLPGLVNLLNAKIESSGSSINYLDTEFISQVESDPDMVEEYIFNKNRAKREAYLFIPVKLLPYGTTYNVTIPQGIVKNDSADDAKQSNQGITWNFTTMAIPSVVKENIIVQSVVERYDKDEPLIIYGDFFYKSTVDVYFNNERADRVRLNTDDDGNQYLEVYLPDGRRRLEPGLYNISVQNDKNHKVEILGILSVVEKGEHIPQDGYRIKESNRYEEVIETVSRSEDTLYLDRYSRNRKIDLDLDELMGQDTLTRKIVFEDGNSSSIRGLDTLSKWANVNINNIRLSGRRNEESYIYIGRIEPFLAQSLKRNLQNYNIKSEMIQMLGNDVSFSSVEIELPYDRGNEEEFIVLRYDETSRAWTEETFNIDRVDQRVIINGVREGIFLVVEPK